MMNSYEMHPALRDAPKEQILCFTGHRPRKLPTGKKLELLTATLYYYIDVAVRQGYRIFLTGLAEGIDYLAGEYVLALRSQNPEIKLIGVQPCDDYEDFFRKRHYNSQHLQHMKNAVNALICLPGHSSDAEVFFIRNRFMVDHASAVIAVCTDKHSGSMQTLSYAKQQGLAWCHIPADIELLYSPTPEQWPVLRSGF